MNIRLTSEEEALLKKIAEDMNMTKTDVLKQALYIKQPINIQRAFQYIMSMAVAIERIETIQGVTEYSVTIREGLMELCHILNL